MALKPVIHGSDHRPGGADPALTGVRHLVGVAGEPAFQNSWTNEGGTTEVMQFWLVVGPGRDGNTLADNNASLEIAGSVNGGTYGTVVFTLPDGYRPAKTLYFEGSDSLHNVLVWQVDPSGDVTVHQAALADGTVTAAMLEDSGVVAGTYGDASHVAEVTVDAKGRITSAVSTAIAIAESAVTGLVSDLAGKLGLSTFTTKGDIVVATGSGAVSRVGVGVDGQVLTADSAQATGVKWDTPTGGTGDVATDVIWDAKGDLAVGTGADTAARLAVGANGDVLTADSTQTTGTKWQAPAATLPGDGEESLYTVAASTATLTVDFTNGATQDITLTANCTLSLTGAVGGEACSLTLILRQDATGSRTVTWPGSVTWLGAGIAPTLHTAAASVDTVVLFTVDGGTTWLGVAQTSASGLAAGTSFPGSPSDGDLFYRTDRRILYEYLSSASKWLSLDRKYVAFDVGDVAPDNTTTAGNIGRTALFEDVYVESWNLATRVTTTNNGSNYWTINLQKTPPGNTAGTVVTSVTTNADAASSWVQHTVSIGAVIASASFAILEVNTAKTGTPGTLRTPSVLVIRSVG